MTDKMTKFFGLDTTAGQAALIKAQGELAAEITATFGVPRHLLGKEKGSPQ